MRNPIPLEIVCPRLYFSQKQIREGSLSIASADIDDLCHEAKRQDSEPGLLIHFDEHRGKSTGDWALIPFSLFQQLLEATQKLS